MPVIYLLRKSEADLEGGHRGPGPPPLNFGFQILFIQISTYARLYGLTWSKNYRKSGLAVHSAVWAQYPHLSQAYSDPAGKSSALAGLAPPHPKILDPPLEVISNEEANE